MGLVVDTHTIWHISNCLLLMSIKIITGKVVQQFDYSKDDEEKEFMCAACSPSGQSFVLGSFDR